MYKWNSWRRKINYTNRKKVDIGDICKAVLRDNEFWEEHDHGR